MKRQTAMQNRVDNIFIALVVIAIVGAWWMLGQWLDVDHGRYGYEIYGDTPQEVFADPDFQNQMERDTPEQMR